MVAALATSLLTLAVACTEPPSGQRSVTSADPTGTIRGGRPAGDWPTFGRSLSNDRYNASAQGIDASSVKTLSEVWHRDGLTGVSSTPAVAGDTVYFGDWKGVVHAASIVDGTDHWKADLGVPIMSSPTLDGDAVFVATNNELIRLRRSTGEVQWKAQTSDHPIAISPASPVVVDGLVIQGVASGELMIPRDDYSFKGTITAFDTESGRQKWKFELTTGDTNSGAGVGIWSTPSVDRERETMYVGTGNTYEPPASPNADSILALKYKTGDVVWKTQFTHPDVWSMGKREGLDADVGSGPNLWEVNGKAMVGAGDKRGVFHALDRDTGRVAWETPMTPGSALGGVIGTSAYADGTVYVASNMGNEANNAPTGDSKVFALDAATGKPRWEVPMTGAVFASVTVIPGVVLVGTTAAAFHALDATNGAELWTKTVPDQVGSGPSVVGDTIYWGYGYSLFGTGSGIGGLYALRPGVVADPGTSVTRRPTSRSAELFRTSCSSCHGPRGQGGTGPDLRGVDGRYTLDQHIELVRTGRNQMPSFGTVLSDEEIRQIVEYERTELQRQQ